MILPLIPVYREYGYMAGVQDGIVTVGGEPARRNIVVFDADTLQWLQTVESNEQGRYVIQHLNPKKKYVLMCRDAVYEPVCWDRVEPLTDLSIEEQYALW